MRFTRRTMIAAAPLSLAGCAASSGVSVSGFASGDGSYTVVPVEQRVLVPELVGTTLDGTQLRLSDYLGTVVVVNVWGSWCAPCRHEAPALVEAATRSAGSAQFIGINTRDLDVAPAQAFVRAFKVPYPNIFDPDGALLLAFGQLPPKAIPSTLIIDSQGRAAARILGEVTTSTIIGSINDIAAS